MITATIISELTDLQAVELLPEINALFDTGMVNLGFCGNRTDVQKDIADPRYAGSADSCILDIHKRFEDMRRTFA